MESKNKKKAPFPLIICQLNTSRAGIVCIIFHEKISKAIYAVLVIKMRKWGNEMCINLFNGWSDIQCGIRLYLRWGAQLMFVKEVSEGSLSLKQSHENKTHDTFLKVLMQQKYPTRNFLWDKFLPQAQFALCTEVKFLISSYPNFKGLQHL